ncbi:helix-turn-helix domain-containing protein [Maribacter aurantiacus]|uniref:Helix-turn-helix domain-containing protein n=1 Tax=Maribacter aurantiacus TaxID=1882343 RepID=A0A5R8M4T5_9FLAO|nr:helix-turn-helix domain-containing protein [Maribacter aurantiacus]TLF44576.1 helix-turn-helix domain-containing protein [Maribacter aurantiacus]
MTTASHKEYVKANLRLEELIKVVDDNTPFENPLTKEFLEVSNIIEQYEEVHYSIGLSSLVEVIELRMLEMNLKRKDLATLLNTSESKISAYLKDKKEITLKHARILHQKLNIDGDIILQ